MSVLSCMTRLAAKRILPARCYRQRAQVIPDAAVSSGNPDRLPVCLTFDDGPHPDFTPRVLDQLANLNAKGTFFLIGSNAQQYPAIVRRLVADGHTVGSHTHCHSRATRMTADEYVQDAVRGQRIIEDLTGFACPLFRPPHGELTPLSLLKLLRTGMRVVHWTHEPKDFDSTGSEQLKQWFLGHRPDPGAVVVLHDACRNTAQHLIEFIDSWREEVRFCGLTAEGTCQ